MELTRVVLLCCDEPAYAGAKAASFAGRRVAMGDADFDGIAGVEVLETAPVTHGVITDATVVVAVRGRRTEGAADAASAPTPPHYGVPHSASQWVAPFARPRRAADIILRSRPDVLAAETAGRLGPNTCLVSWETAVALSLKPGGVAVVEVDGTDADAVTREFGFEITIGDASVGDEEDAGAGTPVLYLPPDIFTNVVADTHFPSIARAMCAGVSARLLRVAAAGTKGVGAIPCAAEIEVRPQALPHTTVGEMSATLSDAALEQWLTRCKPGAAGGDSCSHSADTLARGPLHTPETWPGLLLHTRDTIVAPVPRDASSAVELAGLDVAAVLDPSAAGVVPATEGVRFVISQAVDGEGYLLTDTPFYVNPATTRVVFATSPVPRPPAPALPCMSSAHPLLLPVNHYAAYATLTDFVASIMRVGGGYSGTVLLAGGGDDVDANGACLLAGAAAREVGCHVLEVTADTIDAADFRSVVVAGALAHPTVVVLRNFEAWFEKGGAKKSAGGDGGDGENKDGDAGGGGGSSTDAVAGRMKSVLEQLAAGELQPRQGEVLGGADANDGASLGETPLRGVVVVAVADASDSIPPAAASFFHKTIKLLPPDATERTAMLTDLLRHVQTSRAVTAERLAKATAGMTCLGLAQCVATALCNAERNVSAALNDDGAYNTAFADPSARVVVQFADFTAAIGAYSKSHSINVSTNIQKVSWKDIGGLKEAKAEIMQCIHLPLAHPGLFRDSGLKPRRGVLMFGPPGCGKTLLAKGVATECGLNFLSVKGPEMLNMYVGESERNIRNLFAKARQASPCVVFFDELDALVPNRGAKGDSGGVMDRIVAQLLTELDSLGTDPDEFVFIIGATNRPDLIDPSLLRPGRFDRCVYLGVAASSQEQATILKAQTRKMNLDANVDLLAVTSAMPKTYSGADMYALSTEALMLAMREKVDDLVKNVEAKREQMEARAGDVVAQASDSDDDDDDAAPAAPADAGFDAVVVQQQHFEAARQSCTPSITERDLARYNAMKAQFAATAVV